MNFIQLVSHKLHVNVEQADLSSLTDGPLGQVNYGRDQ